MRRGVGVVLAWALIALGATSCGDGDSERDTAEPIRRVAQAADAEESYRFRVEFDVADASEGEPADPSDPIVQELDGFTLEGMVDPSRQAGTTKLSGFAFEPASTSIAFRFMDGVAYADLSGLRESAGPNFLPEGISWVSLDEDDDPSAITGLPISAGLGRFDPAGVFHLAGVIRARRTGSEKVGGVETELSDFGVAVDVEALPPEETITLDEFQDRVVGESE